MPVTQNYHKPVSIKRNFRV